MALITSLRHLAGRALGRQGGASSVPAHVRLMPDMPVRGRMLLSYSTYVYERLLRGEPLKRTHISPWHNFQISRTFLDLGFQVDVMPFDDHVTVPGGQYDVMVDIVSNLGRLDDSLGSGCLKILHPMSAHWTENNSRNYARHAALAHRRGIALKPLRLVEPNDSVEHADYITCRGGAFGRGSYEYRKVPILQIPQLTAAAIEGFIERDMAACRHRFVWLAGSGAVHKGLDLMLEAFAGLPDCHLTVCGGVSSEKEFVAHYHRELYQLPNIETLDWVDTMSDQFRDIVSRAAAIVLPSASEFSCGSVIAGMMTGLIPVTTPSTDIDVTDIGYSITEDSVEGVRAAVCALRDASPTELEQMSRAAWEAVGERYGRDRFLAGYREAICRILDLPPADIWQRPDDAPRIPDISLCRL